MMPNGLPCLPLVPPSPARRAELPADQPLWLPADQPLRGGQ
jgi:hypothetical protein